MYKQPSVVSSISLSANGSKTIPIIETTLYFLARYPSKKSVILAVRKIIKANEWAFSIGAKKVIGNNGTRKSLIIVRMFGTYFIVTPPGYLMYIRWI